MRGFFDPAERRTQLKRTADANMATKVAAGASIETTEEELVRLRELDSQLRAELDSLRVD